MLKPKSSQQKTLAGKEVKVNYCKFGNFTGFYFHETSHMQSFVKIRPSRNGKITLSFTYIGKSCLSFGFFNVANMSSRLFEKIKLS